MKKYFILIIMLSLVLLTGCKKALNNKAYKSDDQFDKLVIEEVASNIEIKKSENDYVLIEYEALDEKYYLEFSMENKILTIKRIDNKTAFDKNLSLESNTMIYLPQTFNGEINVNQKAGNLSIEGLDTTSISIDKKAGETILKSIKTSSIEIKNEAGTIDLCDVSTGSLEIDAEIVDIKQKNIDCENKISIASEVGSIELDNIKSKYLFAKCDMGSINASVIDVVESASLITETGKINLSLKGKQTEFSIHATTGVGKHPENTSTGTKQIILKTNVGDISISYAD